MRFSVRSLAPAFILLGLAAAPALAQSSSGTSYTDNATPPGVAKGAHPLGSYGGGQFDNVSYFNGNVSMTFSLAQLAGRAGMGAGVLLSYNSKTWRPLDLSSGVYDPQAQPIVVPVWDEWDRNNGIAPGWRITAGHMYARHAGWYPETSNPSCEYWTKTLTRLYFVAPDGTEYEFRDRMHNGEPQLNGDCGSAYVERGREWYTADGTAASFVSDTSIWDFGTYVEQQTETVVSGTVFLRDGTQFGISGGKLLWQRDRNGNRTTFEYIAAGPGTGLLRLVTDSLGRQIEIAYPMADTNGDGVPEIVAVTVTLVREAPAVSRVVTVELDSLSNLLRDDQPTGIPRMGELFPGYEEGKQYGLDPETPFNPQLVKCIELPGGYAWTFQYNPHGEVARVGTPSKGAVRYDYDFALGHSYSAINARSIIFRRVTVRRTYATDAETQASSAEAITTYSDPTDGANYDATAKEQLVTETRSAALAPGFGFVSRTQHYFSGSPMDELRPDYVAPWNLTGYPKWKTGREVRTVERGWVNGQWVDRSKVETNWEQRANVPWLGTVDAADGPANDTRVASKTTTILENGANLVSRTTYAYDDRPATSFNNVELERTYDWGMGVPGALIREVDRTYLDDPLYTGYGYLPAPYSTRRAPHLRSLVTKEIVRSAEGGASESVTEFEYDGYYVDTNGRRSPLVPRPTLTTVGHEAWYDDGLTRRGNVTMTAVGVTLTPSLEAAAPKRYMQYDVAGNVVVMVDPRVDEAGAVALHHKTFVDYETTDFAFPLYTRRTVASEPTELVRETHFDRWTGQLVSMKGENGEETTYFYQDQLDRLTYVDRPGGTGAGSVGDTSYTYSAAGSALRLTERTQVDASTWVEAVTDYDGLGRPTRVTTTDPDGGGTIVTNTIYDGLGRAVEMTNPERGDATDLATRGYTRTWYDDQSRVTRVETFDTSSGTAVSTGAVTTVYNESPYSYTPVTNLSALGTTVQVTDQAGKARRSVTDAAGRLRVVVEDPSALGYQTLYRYDARGNLTFVDQGQEQQRRFVYDAQGRLTSATQPEWGTTAPPGTTTYQYDLGSNLTRRLDPRGASFDTVYAYDSLNRVTSRDDQNTSGVIDATYYYDSDQPAGLAPPSGVFPAAGLRFTRNRLYAVVTAQTSETEQEQTGSFYAYDAPGRVTSYSQLLGGTYYTTTTSYTLAGAVDVETSYEGTTQTTTIDNGYNAAGLLSTVSRNGGLTPMASVATDGYTPAGALSKQQLGNGLLHTIAYNSRQQPTAIMLGSASAPAEKLRLDYTYGVQQDPLLGRNGSISPGQNNGNVARIKITPGSGEPFEQNFLYDELNRLKLANEYFATGGGSTCTFTSAPVTPTGLAASATGTSTSPTVTLSWTEQADECNYVVYRSTSETGTYTAVQTTAANATSFVDSQVAQSTTYWYKLQATNNIGGSALSAPVSVTTLGACPALPTAFTAANVNGLQINLSWSATGVNGESGFLIERAEISNGQGYSFRARVGADVTSYADSVDPAQLGTTFQYRITSEPCTTPVPEERWVYSNQVTATPLDWGLKFDGVDDYADAASSSSLNVTGSITVEAWVVLHELGYYNVVVSKHTQNVAEGGYTLAITNTNLPVFSTYGSGGAAAATVQGSGALLIKRWYHLAGVYDGTKMYLFVDGQLAASSTVGAGKGAAASSSAFQVGRTLNRNAQNQIVGAKYLRGKVDEVRISNSARYTAAFTITDAHKNHQPDANSRALWKMNESTGPTAADSSSSGNALTLRNQTLWKPGVTTNNVDKRARRPKRRESRVERSEVGSEEKGTGGGGRIVPGFETPLWTEEYLYDRWGNMRWGGGSVPAKASMAMDAAKNRVASVDGNTSAVRYDAAGNVTEQVVGPGTHQYSYTSDSRMWKAVTPAGTTRYVYDGEGRRVKKVVGSVETKFVYGGGGQLTAEYEAGIRTKEYVYGASGLLAVIDYPGQTNEAIKYLTPDHLGTPRVITGGTGADAGVVLSRHDYKPFGEELVDGGGVNVGRSTNGYNPIVPDRVRQQFTSYERDAETGLDFAEARYYTNTLGRFASRDSYMPWAAISAERDTFTLTPGNWNSYSYVLNNPLRYHDPDGLAPRFTNAFTGDQKDMILKTLNDIAQNGSDESKRIANLILQSDILFDVRLPKEAPGTSGTAGLTDTTGKEAQRAIDGSGPSGLSLVEGMSLQTITINTAEFKAGLPALEGSLVHEGKHAEINATLIAAYSVGIGGYVTEYSHEIQAATAAAGHFAARGGQYAAFGATLGINRKANPLEVDHQGIKNRVFANYGLTPANQGSRYFEERSIHPKWRGDKRRMAN